MLWQKDLHIQESVVSLPLWRDLSSPPPLPPCRAYSLSLKNWREPQSRRSGSCSWGWTTLARPPCWRASPQRTWTPSHRRRWWGSPSTCSVASWAALNTFELPPDTIINCCAFGNDIVRFTWGWNPGLSDLGGLYLILWDQLDQHTLPHKVAGLRYLLLS